MIIKRGSKYGVRIYCAGRQAWVGTFDKLSEARAAERQAQSRPRASFNLTVADYIERWKSQYPRPRASTNRHNRYMVKSFAAEFGDWQMSAISKPLARDSALRHRASVSVVRAMFNDALREEVVASNPFADMRLPQSRGRKDLIVLSSTAEVRELADVALDLFGYGPTFRACVLFAASGRAPPQAELFMLTWDDIEGDELVIRNSLGSTGEVTRQERQGPPSPASAAGERGSRWNASSCRFAVHLHDEDRPAVLEDLALLLLARAPLRCWPEGHGLLRASPLRGNVASRTRRERRRRRHSARAHGRRGTRAQHLRAPVRGRGTRAAPWRLCVRGCGLASGPVPGVNHRERRCLVRADRCRCR